MISLNGNKETTAHEGPLPRIHPNYNGSPYNLSIEWENEEITNEPRNMIAADDPMSFAIYGQDNKLPSKNGKETDSSPKPSEDTEL